MTPSKRGQARSHRLPWVLSLCLALVSPVPVWADLYTWVDDRGVQNIVDNPTLVPEQFRRQARRFMTPSASRGQAPSTSLQAPVEPPAVSGSTGLRVEPPAPETQGSVAVALAERLGLAHPATPLQAASVLLERGILPPAGWMLDEPIDPAWVADLARSLLEAGSAGRILQTPEAALRTLEGVAAERGIAVVAFEPPPPPQPQVIVTQPAALIVETTFVPAFPLHTRSFFHHPHFRKRFFTDHPHLWQHFPKSTRGVQHHPMDLRPGHRPEGKIAGSPTGGSRMLRPEPLDSARGKLVEGLTTGGGEKRSGSPRCASSGSTVLTAGSMGRSVRICP